MGLRSYLARQAARPSGWFGRLLVGRILNRANASLEDLGMDLIEVQPDSKILEIGFGNGRLIAKMAKYVRSGKITGIEISEEMIAAATRKISHLIESGKVELVHASVDSIPADNDSFDKIFTANTIYFWPDPDENIKEVLRTLRSGGKFYCGLRLKEELLRNRLVKSNLEVFKNLYSRNDIREFLLRAGFSDVSVHMESGEHYMNVVVAGVKK